MFFFKQKTAYEMRISDWSSDVCSSDLGIQDYAAFGREVLSLVPDRPVSLEVFADQFDEMERQALEIASWGDNVNVKIPVTNTKGEPSTPWIERLSARGPAVNVTADLTLGQGRTVGKAIQREPPAHIPDHAGTPA